MKDTEIKIITTCISDIIQGKKPSYGNLNWLVQKNFLHKDIHPKIQSSNYDSYKMDDDLK